MTSEKNSEYHVFFLQLLDFLGAEAEHPAEDFVVVLAEDRRRLRSVPGVRLRRCWNPSYGDGPICWCSSQCQKPNASRFSS